MREKDIKLLSEPGFLLRLRNGDEKAFSTLFYTYKDKLYDFVLGMTRSEREAEDTVQNVFLKIWNNRENMPAVDNFNAYIYSMARNQMIDIMRKFTRNTDALESITDERDTDTSRMPMEKMLFEEVKNAIDDAVAQLPNQQRRAFVMRKFQGLSQADIAQALSVSVATATGYTKEAAKSVRTYLLSHYPELFIMAVALLLDQ